MKIEIIEFVVGFGLLSLFLFTILKEFEIFSGFLRRLVFFTHLLPSWSFFAPLPIKLDYFFFYRFIYRDGNVSEWGLVDERTKNRPAYAFLWNPGKRQAKSFVDIVLDLIKVVGVSGGSNQICVSLPYLHLLNFTNSLKRCPLTIKIQFMIMSKSNLYDAELVFLSEAHPV